MHPPLAPHKHERCVEQILALTQCHDANPYSKLWGKCNDVRLDLDKCLRGEYLDKLTENRRTAKERAEQRKQEMERLGLSDSSSS